MSEDESSPTAAGVTLQAHVEELRSCCEAVSRFQSGSTYYWEESGIFSDYARERGFLLEAWPEELNRPPDDEGNEHQVWFVPEEMVFKATWPGFYGLLVVHRPSEENRASPIDYLERWSLHNEIFGDAISWIGAFPGKDGLRLVIRQPAIAGEPATDDEIAQFFGSSGWKRFVIEGNTAYFDPGRGLVVSDTHRGNIIRMQDGLLAPIDLRVQQLSGALLGAVAKLCEK